MKKKIKKLCMVLVSIMMVLSAVGIQNSFAKGDPVCVIELNTEGSDKENDENIQYIWYNYGSFSQDNIEGVSFDPSTFTLTFNNFSTDKYLWLFVAKGLKINLKGTNSVGGIILIDSSIDIDGDNNATLIINRNKAKHNPINIAASDGSIHVSSNINFRAFSDESNNIITSQTKFDNLKDIVIFDAAPDKLNQEGTQRLKQSSEEALFEINKYITNGTIYTLKDGITGDEYKKNIAVVPQYNKRNEIISNSIYKRIDDRGPFYQMYLTYPITFEDDRNAYNKFISNYEKKVDITNENKIYLAENWGKYYPVYKSQSDNQEIYALFIDDNTHERHYYRLTSIEGLKCLDKTQSHLAEGLEKIMEPVAGIYDCSYNAEELSVDAVITEQPKDEPNQPEQKPVEPKTDTDSTKTDTPVVIKPEEKTEDHNTPAAETPAPSKTAEASPSSQTPAQSGANTQETQTNPAHPIPTKTAKPGRVGNLKIKLTKKKAKVSWKKVKNAKKYEIAYKQKGTYYRKNKKGKKQKVSYQWVFKTVKKTSVTIKNLKKNKKYSLKVRAINGSKKGKWSSIKSFTAR